MYIYYSFYFYFSVSIVQGYKVSLRSDNKIIKMCGQTFVNGQITLRVPILRPSATVTFMIMHCNAGYAAYNYKI